MIYRDTNKRCFCCGSQLPSDVDCIWRGISVIYECPKCGDTILQGIVADGRDREMSPVRPPDRVPEHVRTIPMQTDFRIWEVWWTDRLYIVMMHGQQIAGNEALREYVEEIENVNNE